MKTHRLTIKMRVKRPKNVRNCESWASCCLPLVPFLFAAGAAGGSAFFVKLRPFLLAASVLLVALGFYQLWRAKQCNSKPNLLGRVVLWFSAVVVLVSILFPQAIANFVANLLAN
jgi:hypothetical protein